MKLEITYSLASEFHVVHETIADLTQITADGDKVWLPGGITSESTPADMREAIAAEFNPVAVNSVKEEILTFFKTYSGYITVFAAKYSFKPPETIYVTLTRYGVGSYYESPNTIVINLRSTYDTPIAIFMRELIYLTVEESIVQKFNLDQAAKEGLVDYLFLRSSILRKLVPGYRMQSQTTLPSPELTQYLKSL